MGREKLESGRARVNRVQDALEAATRASSNVHKCHTLIGDLTMGKIIAVQIPRREWDELVLAIREWPRDD